MSTHARRVDSKVRSASAGHVIVVDDDPSVLQTMVLNLLDAGYAVTGVDDPVEALNLAMEAPASYVIVDLKMPGVDGLDLVSALCAQGRHAVILISAFVDVATTVAAMRMGAADVITKPIRPEALVSALERAQLDLREPSETAKVLTPRERQVAKLIVAGKTTKQIANVLTLSPRTVEFFRASLLKKTGSPNTASLVAALTREGFAAN